MSRVNELVIYFVVSCTTYLYFWLWQDIGLNVELWEEDEEHDGVGTDEVAELPGEVAIVVEELK